MKLPANTILLALATMLFASCGTSTPQARIEKDPARYGKLTAKDRSLVDAGKIGSGMSQDAVYLAWGKPHTVSKGGDGGSTTERWTYTGQTPVWSNQFNVGYGGGYGRCRGYGPYYDYGPTIAYVPYTAGVVHFTNGRVSKWEERGN